MNLPFVPSQANFLLVEVGDGKRVFKELQTRGIITRSMGVGLEKYLRISVGTELENDRALNALEDVLSIASVRI